MTTEVSQGAFVFTYDFAGEAKQRADLSDVAPSFMEALQRGSVVGAAGSRLGSFIVSQAKYPVGISSAVNRLRPFRSLALPPITNHNGFSQLADFGSMVSK